ncbi:MAG: phosphomethylpyrimidine synthase ThiC [Candidatus Bathyarchaeia archaeon]|nr:phosphomethylpyrimidine synthase ThiC [Candidatus Bathyarchaeota archaeon]
MKSAVEGRETEEMRLVAMEEDESPQNIRMRIAEGSLIITRNIIRENVHPVGIGKGLRIKVNANVGTSQDLCDINLEVEKASIAVKYGADTVMDLSTSGNLDEVRRAILKAVNVPVGTVPIYQAAIEAARKKGSIVHMSEDDIFNVIEKHAKDGVDFMTLHCGVTKEIVNDLTKQPRLMGIVSRGGVFIATWIIHNGEENPLYKNYDYLLELAAKYDFAISLGDGMRPGCIFDATDHFQIKELLTIGRLVERARRTYVQVMVEGPGHLPLNHIEANVRLAKAICKDAPFYVLGPVVTEIAPGYDHIVAAIGGALAGLAGADFLCYVTPAEHLGLPSVDDVKEGVIAARIAAHAADIVRLGSKAAVRDLEMAKARASLNWRKQMENAIDQRKALEIRGRVKLTAPEACSMCSEYCAIKMMREYFKTSCF